MKKTLINILYQFNSVLLFICTKSHIKMHTKKLKEDRIEIKRIKDLYE